MSQPIQYCKCDLKYKELTPIDTNLLQQIKLVFIFADNSGAEIFIITQTDDVYGYGANKNGKLGLGHNNQVKEPTLITELWGKNVKNIQCGQQFTVALTESGAVYSFGSNLNDLLQREGSQQFCKPKKMTAINEIICEIKCTNTSTYLLSSETGQIFWLGYRGYNQNIKSMTPTKIEGMDDYQVISISCGSDHTLALTDTGKVFSLGSNFYGQLGLGHRSHTETPAMIQFNDIVFIKQISCGCNHSLVLSSDGDIYAFGYNNGGQLGFGDLNIKLPRPVQIIHDNKFQEIFAFGNMSLALDQNSKLFVWGFLYEERVNIPKITKLSSFQEAINIYSQNMCTFTPLSVEDIFKPKTVNRLTKTMAKAFNNPKYSDLMFKFKRTESEDKFDYIYGHKWFIAENSEHFQTMFSNNWSETETNEVLITGYSHEAYYQFIRFFYTDSVESDDINVFLELLSISEEYFDDDLKQKSIELMKPLINVENVCSVYSSSIKFRANHLKEFCFKLMSRNIDSFVKTDDYNNMDPIYSKQFFTEYYTEK